ncbi:MAG: hypothetical protein ACLPKE_09920 [Streptosporangiaceae bacterium]
MRTSRRLASLTRSALSWRAFGASFGFASADLHFDLLSLDLMFLAFGYQPGLEPLVVAYDVMKRRHLSVYHRQILVGGGGFPIHWY